jgi:NTE family protein
MDSHQPHESKPPNTQPIAQRAVLSICILVSVLTVLMLAGGCSTTKPWVNEALPPLPPGQVSLSRPPSEQLDDQQVSLFGVLALSGGGTRAAAFAYGVMQELKATQIAWEGRETTVLDEIDTVHGVSGGSITAAYYAAFGDATFLNFENEFLRQNFQRSLVTRALRPDNAYRLTSPWFGRSHVLAQRLDELFHGKTFADLSATPGRHAPQLVVSATDLTLGMTFEFSQEQFDQICSDLSSVPLSFAVAASSSVPILLSPMTLRNHAGACPRPLPEPDVIVGAQGHQSTLLLTQAQSYVDAEHRPYIHLVDGGLSDNIGVRRALDTMMSQGGLVRLARHDGPHHAIRRLFVIAVNSERDPGYRIDLSDRTPTTLQVLDSLMFGSGSQASRDTLALLRHTMRRWQHELRDQPLDPDSLFTRDAELHVITVNLRDLGDRSIRQTLLRVPTAFTLSDTEITQLIAAGRQALRESQEFRALIESLASANVAPVRATAASDTTFEQAPM